jgi:hypothetical protein
MAGNEMSTEKSLENADGVFTRQVLCTCMHKAPVPPSASELYRNKVRVARLPAVGLLQVPRWQQLSRQTNKHLLYKAWVVLFPQKLEEMNAGDMSDEIGERLALGSQLRNWNFGRSWQIQRA